MRDTRRVLIAGVGNVLEGDDGFGVRVVEWLQSDAALPSSVVLRDVGIGGIHLVQDLMDGFDALIVVDAVRNGGATGTLYVLDPRVPSLAEAEPEFRPDTHYAIPRRALMLARSVGVLPGRVYLVGCEPGSLGFGIGLSPAVRRAVTRCATTVASIASALAAGEEPRFDGATGVQTGGAGEGAP